MPDGLLNQQDESSASNGSWNLDHEKYFRGIVYSLNVSRALSGALTLKINVSAGNPSSEMRKKISAASLDVIRPPPPPPPPPPNP
jgi:hypothetical protein